MRIIRGTVRGAFRLAHLPELSREARRRLEWMDYYRKQGGNARLTCRLFDISPQTFYRWKCRYNPGHLRSLEDHSRKPKHLRQPTWSVELAQAVLSLREQYLRWGKDAFEAGWLAGVHLYGGAHSEAPQGAGGAPGTPQEWSGY